MEDLNLIELISERHIQLRELSENLWNEHSDIYMANSEWLILARVFQKGETPISWVTKQVNITRQATHKFVKRLKEKGLIQVTELKNNKKEKAIKITDLGKECYERKGSLEIRIEQQIADKIGSEQVNQLKRVLRSEWGV
ncbi:DNA-binding transcriptional regulator, MarR family [Lentibacillus persicus]|uniref:DNA-binding transcriptional regulator, MarR family n=1 Tax=Lentibacillus persicus TaxID=640948 RepID=A0A1I1XCN9_9BACI|nr:winged helix DNA-binding protein [Lentibacillus persicus]SFE05125.1 DNA-binding transcriptional regulator, MarR family [Lentibacillus persicus]